MALADRSLKWKEADEIPLMDESNEKILSDEVNFANGNDSDVEAEDEKPFKQHDITLWFSDAIVLIVEHLQYYAVLLSLSEHWGWPINWVDITSFTFLFNADIWEFRKVSIGAFNHSRTSFIKSSTIGFNYVSYLASWAVFLIILAAVFTVVYVRWMKKRPLYMLLYVARWKRVMFLVLQFLCMPFGVAAARVFHCRIDASSQKEVMDVQNEFECFNTAHIAFMVLVILIFVVFFFFYPFVLMRWIRDQVFSNDPIRHEGYLQLKEAEYEQGLDILWDLGQYHLFSSFRRFWIYYNPLKFFFKFIMIAGFALSVKSAFWASAGITVLFVIAFFALILKRPFRVRCFNLMAFFSHLIIATNCLIGNFMVRPPWENTEQFQIVSFLRYPTILHILVAINGSWLFVLVLWIVYLFLLNNGVLGKERIWPRLSYESSNAIGEDTKKYLKAALKARHTLERALSSIPLFAPVHELSHQVKVINAYCREAEYIGDPTHDTLWDLLDELIEAHNALASVSVFGMSGKNSIRETSEEFIKLMPSFRKRLKQRECDYILVPPVKRRLLLKMYILSVFVGNKRKHASPDQEITTKLQEALAMFDGRSLDDYDTGFSSTSPSTISASTGRPLSEMRSRGDTNVTGFINELDAYFPKQDTSDFNDSLSSRKTSASSRMSYGYKPTTAVDLKQSQPTSRDRSEKKLSIPSVSSRPSSKDSKREATPSPALSSKPSTPKGNKVSPADSPRSNRSPRGNRISPLVTSEESYQEREVTRPGTAPLTPISSRTSHVSRPGTTPTTSRRTAPTTTRQNEMSSTISLPGQVETHEEAEFQL